MSESLKTLINFKSSVDSAWHIPHNKKNLTNPSLWEVQIQFKSWQPAFFATYSAETYPLFSKHNYLLKTKLIRTVTNKLTNHKQSSKYIPESTKIKKKTKTTEERKMLINP